ncbi:MAG: SLBB domain-containing protein [Ferruginibacter sp.]
MKFSAKFSFFCVLFFFFIFHGIAQVNSLSVRDLSTVHIDEISDEDIEAYFIKAKENGVSEQNMYRLLLDKGMPREEINKLEERLSKLSFKSSNNEKKSTQVPESTAVNPNSKNRYPDADSSRIPSQVNKIDISIFGSELFATNSLVFEPNLRIATPAGYILGPDDELVINIFGYSEKTYNLRVNEEGSIYIPQVGPISVNGLSMDQATTKIRSKLASTIYKAINSGQTSIQVSLGKIRSIRVTVIGESKKPGSYTVSSLTTLFNLLYLCGGPSDFGSYRKIELIRGNQLKRTVDLYGFLTKGDQKDNVLLQEGDVVRIPYYKTRIILNGNVKHKGKYELVEGETFENVLQFSGGFADDAYKAGITIYQLTENERKITDLARDRFNSYKPSSSDSIVVGKLLDNYENKLTIKGAIMRPGDYELSQNLSLKELIVKAGGVKEDVYSKRGSISRLNFNRTPVQVSFDIDSVLNGSSVILLKKNDKITLYSIFDLRNQNEIIIDGFIRKPGTYEWAENISLRDIILAAGGLTLPGDLTKIEIARVAENVDITELNYKQAEILNIDLSDTVAMKDVILRPFDIIHIRQQAGYTTRRMVFIEGEVTNPGRYTLKMSGDRISDLLERSGGFRPNADTSALIIRRLAKKNQTTEDRERIFSKILKIEEDSIHSNQTIRKEIFKDYENISIDLKKALNERNESENMVLEDGDVITIERNTNLVKVSGEVYFPTIIPYKKGTNLKYYIQKSGSYTPLAYKKGALVIYPDGKAKKVKSFLFFRNYPEVVSRSEIIIPQKSDRNKQRISLGEWSVVISSLAIIANVIINIRK